MLYIIIVVVNSTVCLNNEFSQSGSRRNESLTVKQYIRFKLFSKERWHVGLQCMTRTEWKSYFIAHFTRGSKGKVVFAYVRNIVLTR